MSLRLPHRAVSSALPYSLNRAAADGQLVTLSAGNLVEIMPGYDVIVVKLLLQSPYSAFDDLFTADKLNL